MDKDIYDGNKAFMGDAVAMSLLKHKFVALDAEQTKALELTDRQRQSLNDGDILTQRHVSPNGGFLVAVFHRFDGFLYVGACTLQESPKAFLESIRQFNTNRHFMLV